MWGILRGIVEENIMKRLLRRRGKGGIGKLYIREMQNVQNRLYNCNHCVAEFRFDRAAPCAIGEDLQKKVVPPKWVKHSGNHLS